MKCRFCETELERDARYCHICGQAVPVDRSEGGFCPRCDTKLPATAVFCPHCGTQVSYSRLRRAEQPPAETEANPAPAAPAPESKPSPTASEPIRLDWQPQSAKAEPEKKPKRPREKSAAAGLILALILLLLIFGCIAAVLYVEAYTHGISMHEYVSGMLPGSKAPTGEETARWSDLNPAPTPTAAETPTEAVAVEEENHAQEAYAQYIELLRERQERIDRYDWQQEGTETRPVVVCDVCGDSTPELIWAEAADGAAATLNVAGWRNGAVEILFTENWDVQAGGGFCCYLFQVAGDKTLYTYSASGDESWTECYAALLDHGGTLMLEELLKAVTAQRLTGQTYRTVKTFTAAGEEITEDEWRESVNLLNARTASVLMLNRDAGDFATHWAAKNGCPAMTCAEAIDFLTGALEAA